jgi:hypothetical protein
MKKLLSTIETATNAEINEIIQALTRNKHIISIDISTDFEFIECILESIEELFEEYLFENYEDEIEDVDIDEIKMDFIELLKLKDLSFFEEYAENEENFNNYNRWLFSHSNLMSIDEWIELDSQRLFEENFNIKF